MHIDYFQHGLLLITFLMIVPSFRVVRTAFQKHVSESNIACRATTTHQS